MAEPLAKKSPGKAQKRDADEARKFAEDVGAKRLRKLLNAAQKDLTARLKKAQGLGGPGPESFTAVQLQLTLQQVREVLRPLKKQMAGLIVESAGAGAKAQATKVLNFIEQAEAKFAGISRPLNLSKAKVLEQAVSGTQTTALRRIMSDPENPARPGILDRYGANVVKKFETELQQSIITRKSWDETRQALTAQSPFLQQAPAHWAERICRTESMHAANRSSWETMRAVDEELGDMVKILSASFDSRIAADSVAVHGQIRRISEPFDTWYGPMQHPPARPNDREVVVPHRISWPIPGELVPKSDGEVQARWTEEGRKGSPPPRPKLTTVPLEKFGVQTPPPIEMEPELLSEELPPEPAVVPVVPVEQLTFAEPVPVVLPDPDLEMVKTLMGGWKPWDKAQGDMIGDWVELPDELPKMLGGIPMPVMGESIQNPEGITLGEFYKAAMKIDGGAKAEGPTQEHLGWSSISDLVWTDEAAGKSHVHALMKQALPEVKGDMPIIVKTGGKAVLIKGANAALAKMAKGDHDLFGFVLDQDAWAEKKKAEAEAKAAAAKEAAPETPIVLPPMAEPEATGHASEILHEKVGEAAGSNKGGFYVGKDGKKRYVKFYDDPTQAQAEHLANAIYRDLGLGAPRSQLFMHDGRLAYSSEVLEGETLAKAGLNEERAKKFMRGTAADILTGNWDAAGLTKDNAFVTKDGDVIRIDAGGTFLFRAKAGRKPEGVLNQITEWDKFFNSGVNASYHEIAQKAGYATARKMGEELGKQVRAVKELRDRAGGWSKYVERLVPDMPSGDRTKIVEMLEARTGLMLDRLEALKRAGPIPATPEPERPSAKPFAWHGQDDATAKAVQAKIIEISSSGYDEDRAREFSDKLAKKAKLAITAMDNIRGVVSRWTSGDKESQVQREVYRGIEEFFSKEEPGSSEARAVADAHRTRRARWKAMLQEVGAENTEPPEFFDLRRGMSGEEWVLDVARSWQDPKATHTRLKTYAAASWTTLEEKAHAFAGDRNGVVFRWRHCPMDKTFFDQAIDDASFTSSYGPHGNNEAEVIAGPGHSKGLDLPKHDHVVNYKGRRYTYDDRDELIEQLREDGKI